MIDYLASFTNTDLGVFPDTFAVNASGPSATDGTEYVKLFIDDIWGARQALMNRAGLIPDGVTEADGTAQVIEMHNKMCCAPGIGTEWLLNDDPGTTGHRCLLRQGQGILIANYPDLVAAVYVGDGNNATVHAGGGKFYKASDAAGTTPDTAGPYLILDDYRGVVPRGLDPAASIDPDGASRFLGDLQVDTVEEHDHNFKLKSDTATTPLSAINFFPNVGGGGVNLGVAGPDDILNPNIIGSVLVATSSTETRMYNRSTKHVIWY